MEQIKKTAKNTYITFLVFTVFSAVFALIYEYFSHQVYSYAMIFSFAYPLVLGFIPFFVLYKKGISFFPNDFSRLSYSFGIITLMVGSIFKGVLEIYGTTNRHLVIYYYAAALLLFAGIVTWCYTLIKNKKTENKNG